MRIPTHQVHNVLNAYARRLKEKHDASIGNVEDKTKDPIHSYSAEEKRRLIISKFSADIIRRIAGSGPGFNIVTPDQDMSRKNPQAEEIRYHILAKNGDKISSTMKIQDSDFLIKQLEEAARMAAED